MAQTTPIRLEDGRSELFQWDTGRKVVVDDNTIKQVHFQGVGFGRTIDVDVENGVAAIPDKLLQVCLPLTLYAWSGSTENGYTKIWQTFNVHRRNKPADYVFTPSDQLTMAKLQEQIGDLDNLQTTAKDSLVDAINEAAKSGSSGGGDWSQNDPEAADYIKNRPGAYEEVVEPITIQWDGNTEGKTVVDDWFYLVSMDVLTEEQLIGATIGVTVDGVEDTTQILAGHVDSDDELILVSGGVIAVAKHDKVPFEGAEFPVAGIYFAYQSDNKGTMFVSSLTTTRVASVAKIPQKYLDIDGLATKQQVQDASAAAETAQETADLARAEAQNALTKNFCSIVPFTYDKQTAGRDTFIFNAFNYYKISEFAPEPESVLGFIGTNEGGEARSTIDNGENATEYGSFIVVNSAGRCSITFAVLGGGTTTMYFLAPSAGLYAEYTNGNTHQTAGTGIWAVAGSPDVSVQTYKTGLLLQSNSEEQNKDYSVAVSTDGGLDVEDLSAGTSVSLATQDWVLQKIKEYTQTT